MHFIRVIKSAGYYGYSKSNNAVDAEREGKFPLSKATFIVSKLLNITKDKAKWLLEYIGPCEWHHTSSHYNRTNYYDTNIDSIIDYLNLDTEEQIIEFINNSYVKPENKEKGYYGNFEYIIWGGTRNRPTADEQILRNVYIVEKGSFYYVYDKPNGNLLVKKKIGSNGTKVRELSDTTSIDTKENNETKNSLIFSDSEWSILTQYNWLQMSEEAKDFFDKYNNIYNWSSSAHLYPNNKPTRMDYDLGLEKHFNIGDKRLRQTEYPKGYILQEWDGNKFIDIENTNGMVKEFKDLPQDFKNKFIIKGE